MAENLSSKLEETLKECLTQIDTGVPVSPALLASCAIKKLDPEGQSPVLVAWGCNLELRQMARGLLRREYDPEREAIDPLQVEMFDGLQDRYPAKRMGDYVYVERLSLSLDERIEIETRMERHINSRIQHLDGFRAETQALIGRGHFSEVG